MSILRTPVENGRRLRVRPWQADHRYAHVTPAFDEVGPITAAEVEQCLVQLRRNGYRGAVTAALGRADHAPFVEAGFSKTERLHLLVHPLDQIPQPTLSHRAHLRRGRTRDTDELLAVDATAFSDIWRLDRAGLDEALNATPTVHLRVARDRRGMVGYAICGRAAQRGYVQRLAVHPRAQGRGVGATLLVDGLRWLRRWGARDALVNTQEGNGRSLRLYLRTGFVLQPDGLTVLRLDFDPTDDVDIGGPVGSR